MDPPGTSVTQRGRMSAGRPAMSWAAALLAFGLFVGVGAVAVMQGNADNVAATTGQFVDPASAGHAAGAQPKPMGVPTQAAQPGEKVAVPTVGVPVGNDPNAPQAVVGQPAVAPPGITTTTAAVTQPTTTTAQPTTTPPQAVAVATSKPKPTYHRPAAEPDAEPASKPVKPVKPVKPTAAAGDDDEIAKSKKMLEKMQEEQLGGAKF